MIRYLATLVENFPGAANQTRCFTHILNLVAKSILRQFDVPKKKTGDDADERMDFDDATTALAELAQELEDSMPSPVDDAAEGEEPDDDDIINNEIGGDEDDALGDERDGMSEEEVAD